MTLEQLVDLLNTAQARKLSAQEAAEAVEFVVMLAVRPDHVASNYVASTSERIADRDAEQVG